MGLSVERVRSMTRLLKPKPFKVIGLTHSGFQAECVRPMTLKGLGFKDIGLTHSGFQAVQSFETSRFLVTRLYSLFGAIHINSLL